MRAFLHIGLPKTGSTYLQEWLKQNTSNLARAGRIVVPSMSAHRLAVETLDEDLWAREDIAYIRSQVSLAQALADAAHDGAIISSEYFYLANPETVVDLLRSAGLNPPTTIAYLRRQDILRAAFYVQDVIGLGSSDIVEDIVYQDAFDWIVLQRRWNEVSSGIRLMNYDLRKHDLASSFLDMIGIAGRSVLDLQERFNVSPSAEIVEVTRLLNLSRRDFDRSKLAKIEGHSRSVAFGFSSAMTAKFEKLYIKSNRELATMYPGEFDGYACSNWDSPGQDLTGQVSLDYAFEILERLQEDQRSCFGVQSGKPPADAGAPA